MPLDNLKMVSEGMPKLSTTLTSTFNLSEVYKW